MSEERQAVYLAPGAGRPYAMGGIHAVFKADGAQTNGSYSISEWWLEPDTAGPGKHAHPEDDVFYVLDGTMSFWMADHWIDAARAPSCWCPPASSTISRTAAA